MIWFKRNLYDHEKREIHEIGFSSKSFSRDFRVFCDQINLIPQCSFKD
jgi:hypothetical protein